MRVATMSSLSCGALASEKVRRALFGSAGGSSRTKLADWPALNSKPAGFSKRNAVVPSATSSWPASVTSWRAMSEAADFRELARRLVALAVFVVPVELARLFVEGQLVRAVAERLVLRQAAPAKPLLLAVDHVGGGFVGGAFDEACHPYLLGFAHWMARRATAFQQYSGPCRLFPYAVKETQASSYFPAPIVPGSKI